MIESYRDHSANERTFLAWVRTGIAVIAFGLLIEKFNLFLFTLASTSLGVALQASPFRGISPRTGTYEGVAFILAGLAVIVLATARFIRTTRLLDDQQAHSARSVRAELVLCAAIVLLVASYVTYVALS
jgi:putative membrane protein